MAARTRKTTTVKRKSKKDLSVPSYTKSGSKGKPVALPREVFEQEPNETLLAQAVRIYLANQRKAGAKTKRRGEVSKSKRKIWRQKGLGLARHGARSAPIFVGGGVAHGPTGKQAYALELPRKMKKKALISALSAKYEAGDILLVDLEKVEPKTKNIARLLAKLGVNKAATLVHSGSTSLWRAGRNIEDLTLIPAAQITAYEVLSSGKLILTREALGQLTERISGKKDEVK